MKRRLTRRSLFGLIGAASGAAALAACGATPTPRVIEKVVTSVVEREVTKIVEGTPQVVKETVVVQEVVKETVVVEKEVTAAPAAKELEIFMWEPQGEPYLAVGQAIVQEFKADHPEVKVNLSQPGAGLGCNEANLAAAAAGTLPHFSQNCVMKDFIKYEAIYPVDEFPDWQELAATIGEGPIRCMTVDSRVWALPFSAVTFASAMNTDLAANADLDPDIPPATWDNFTLWAEQMTGDGTWGVELPITDTAWLTTSFYHFAFQGTSTYDFFTSDGSGFTIEEPNFKRALEIARTIYQNEWCPHEMPEGVNMLGDGKVGMHLQAGPWYVPIFNRDYPDLRWKPFPTPTPDEQTSETILVSGAGFQFYKQAVKDPKELEMAWELAKYHLRPTYQAMIVREVGELAALKDLELPDDLKGYAYWIQRVAKANKPLDPSPNFYRFRDVFVVYYNKIIRNLMPIDAAIQEMVEKGQAYL